MLGANHSFFEEEAKDKEEEEYKEESEEETEKKKGTQGVNEIENPNLVKPKNSKARDVDGRAMCIILIWLDYIFQTAAEWERRRENFVKEIDFVIADLIGFGFSVQTRQ
ncbi:uncharacterized protein LOC131219407 isoform X2 [Magnolia sinica]|uniref:uncharacterized protein LOC131219407 isoform X2 n=1 Tax=Magnolia sinica TaxID=86752 RepID=UPI002658BBD7|nr:uncharacterized protein LOC131219407 isoform X2 [Magnolia sinica]